MSAIPAIGDTAPLAPSRRGVLLGGLFAATAAVTFVRMPRRHIIAVPPDAFDGILPARFGDWAAVPDADFVLPPADERRAAAVYEDQLTRSYLSAGGEQVMLLVAYDRGQSGMLMIHRPESCYPGSGFTITDTRPVDVPLAAGITVPASLLSTVRGERFEQVLYWTRLGNDFPRDWDAQRSDLAWQNLKGTVPDGALVRLSMITPDAAGALAAMTAFATRLFAGSGRLGRALLAGPANA